MLVNTWTLSCVQRGSGAERRKVLVPHFSQTARPRRPTPRSQRGVQSTVFMAPTHRAATPERHEGSVTDLARASPRAILLAHQGRGTPVGACSSATDRSRSGKGSDQGPARALAHEESMQSLSRLLIPRECFMDHSSGDCPGDTNCARVVPATMKPRAARDPRPRALTGGAGADDVEGTTASHGAARTRSGCGGHRLLGSRMRSRSRNCRPVRAQPW